MLGPQVVGRVLRKLDGTLTIAMETEFILLNSQLSDEVLHPYYLLVGFYNRHILRFCG